MNCFSGIPFSQKPIKLPLTTISNEYSEYIVNYRQLFGYVYKIEIILWFVKFILILEKIYFS